MITTGYFPGNFTKSVEQSFHYLWIAASLINLYLHRYLHIFPVHFHLNHSKSYSCSQVYIIIGIYYIMSLLLPCFTCRLEIMETDNAELISCRLIWLSRAGKIICTVVSCTYRVPEVVLRRMKCSVPSIFISSSLCSLL